MSTINYNLNNRIKQALYTLKRAFGSTVLLYKLETTETDYETGQKTTTSTYYTIPRCIVLPVKIQREVVQTISIISANKEFVQGGTYDSGLREFIIDSRDLPRDFLIRQNDWLLYNDRRYELKQIYELEQKTGWHIIGKEILGPSAINITVQETVTPTETINESI
jgi:hypothetical protein